MGLYKEYKYQRKYHHSVQEVDAVRLYVSALQTAYAVRYYLSTLSEQVHCTVNHMLVEPRKGTADAAEYYLLGDKEPELVHVEAMVGCNDELAALHLDGEHHPAASFGIHHCSHCYGRDCKHYARHRNCCIEVYGV